MRSPETKADSVEWSTANWNRQRAELAAAAEKRFWKLVPADNPAQFEVHDQLGRRIYGPDFFTGLRGFFKWQPPQA